MLKLNRKFVTYLSTCTLSALILLPGIAKAQVQVAPLVIQTETKKGQSRGTVTVTNTGKERFRARVYAAPFTYNRDGFEALESSPNDLTPYLTFSPRELVVEPGQVRRIRIVSRLLPSMKAGEYRAVIFTENLQPIETQSGNMTIGIIPRIGVTLYVRHGDAAANLSTQGVNFVPEQKRINLLVKNTGNASARPEVNWKLSKAGKTVKEGRLEAITVIAEGDRHIPIEYLNGEDKVSAGEYQITGELSWKEGGKVKKLPISQKLNISDREAATANQPPKAEPSSLIENQPQRPQPSRPQR
jgi:P pilus assembly chaperone PapD